jgi:hypothetical protein
MREAQVSVVLIVCVSLFLNHVGYLREEEKLTSTRISESSRVQELE